MRRQAYFILRDFMEKLDPEERVNLYDDVNSTNMCVKDIPDDLLESTVLKFKVDNAVPGIHFKLTDAAISMA